MKSIDEVMKKLSPARKAHLTIGPNKNKWTVEKIVRWLHDETDEDVDPVSVVAFLERNTLPVLHDGSTELEANMDANTEFSEAMERDIEEALVSQLDSLRLKFFVDEGGRSGRQYPAGEFGYIDVLALDSNGNFVVIELKRGAPRKTIGQIAGYLAFVIKHLAKPNGKSVIGWILARPTSPEEDQLLEEAAEAVGKVKWYRVRLELIDKNS